MVGIVGRRCVGCFESNADGVVVEEDRDWYCVE